MLCCWSAGCGVPSSSPTDDAAAPDGPRVLTVTPRLPGALSPSAGEALVGELPDDAPATAAGLAIAVDAGVLVAAERVEPSFPSITLAFTGDTLIHSPLVRRALRNGGGTAYDFVPMFAEVAPIIGAVDLAICHLETPIAPAGEELSTYPRYGVPSEVVAGIASAGYDRCSTASNHSLDRGVAGIDATVAAFDRYGLGQSGMATSPEGALPSIVSVGGISVAHLSYSYGFNGLRVPEDQPWRANEIDPDRVIADARAARARGAQVVVVSLHWGDEGSPVVSDYQHTVAAAITASGAVDLIVGHHAHVIEPIEVVNGVWVVYGLGDFLSNMPVADQWPASTQDGVIVEVTIQQHADGRFQVGRPVALPTWVDKDAGFVIRSVIDDLADPSTSAGLRGRLYASLLRTRAVLGAYIPGM